MTEEELKHCEWIAKERGDLILPKFISAVRELQDEVKSLQFNLKQKTREIGHAEHRGNTVDYIYDKCELYGKQLIEQRTEIERLKQWEKGNAVLVPCDKLKEMQDEMIKLNMRPDITNERLRQLRAKMKRQWKKIFKYERALEQISTEKHYVESQSTGMKQWFPTQGAKIAIKTLEDLDKTSKE